MRLFSILSLRTVALIAFAACGSGTSADTSRRLSTPISLAGEVTNPEAVPVTGEALRVAFVWQYAGETRPDGTYKTSREVSADVAIQSQIPASFGLDITTRPAETLPALEFRAADPNADLSALVQPSDELTRLRTAIGVVVAYEDLNHNGQLDLVTVLSPAYVDRVVGVATAQLIYFEGEMPSSANAQAYLRDSDGKLPSLGFNLLQIDCSARPCKHRWMQTRAPMTVELSEDVSLLDKVMCEDSESWEVIKTRINNRPGDYPATFPPAGDEKVKCDPDGRGYAYTNAKKYQTPPGPCQATTVQIATDAYAIPVDAPIPAGWPCR